LFQIIDGMIGEPDSKLTNIAYVFLNWDNRVAARLVYEPFQRLVYQ